LFLGFAEALETKEENFFLREKEKCKLFFNCSFIEFNQSLLSAKLFSNNSEILKKGKVFLFWILVYGRFLLSISMIAAPITIITMIIATSPYMSVVFEAKPLSGVAVGAAVASVAPA